MKVITLQPSNPILLDFHALVFQSPDIKMVLGLNTMFGSAISVWTAIRAPVQNVCSLNIIIVELTMIITL